MKRNPNFVHHRKIAKDRDSGKLFAKRHGSSRTYDVIVAVTLLALLVVAIVTRATISNKITDSSLDRQSYVADAIDVAATLGVSIGLAVLLFSSRLRADDEGARS
jgi:pilus assembly protein TadC